MVELGGGIIGSVLLGGFGATAGCLATTSSSGHCDGSATLGGVLIGAVVGLSPGVYLAGKVAGADGSLPYTLIGELLGLAALVPAITGLNALSGFGPAHSPDVVVLIAGIVTGFLPFIGSVVMFELTPAIRENEVAAARTRISPLASVSREGTVTAGLGVIF